MTTPEDRAKKLIRLIDNGMSINSSAQEVKELIQAYLDLLKKRDGLDDHIDKISKFIARDLFALGDEPNSPTKRIAFLGGDWPAQETDQGGMCESAFAEFIAEHLYRIKEAKK